MIVMRLRGRLGNQLFIYAFGRALQEKYHMPLVLVDNVNDTGGSKLKELQIPAQVSVLKYSVGHKYDYYNMKAKDYEKIEKGLLGTIKRELAYDCFCGKNSIPSMSLPQRIAVYKHKLDTRKYDLLQRFDREKKDAQKLAWKGLFVCENGWIDFPRISDSVKHLFGFGFFQSEKYFLPIKNLIRSELKRKEKLKKELSDYAAGIRESNSVCLSIRMGDYLNNPILGVCTKQYYEKAISVIYDMYPDAHIYIFSDDLEAVKKTFKFKNKVISEPEGCSETEKLTYMSECKHFIISNSSFSWWVQYLGGCAQKTVIAPDKWTRDPALPCDIYQKGWILVKT